MNISDFSKSRYTHRDFSTLKQDLVEAIPALTEKWTSREESDPGMVLITLMSMLGDNLSYNADKMALEHYIDSVTQRKNCSQILKLLGYKMRWYRAARTTIEISSSDAESFRITTYATQIQGNDITYIITNKHNEENEIGKNKPYSISGSPISFDVVEGSIQNLVFNKSSVIDNRIYFPIDLKVDDTLLWITNDHGDIIGELTSDLRLVDDNYNIYFEFNVDEYDNPYVELSSGWETLTNNSESFSLNYISCKGPEGNVSTNVFKNVLNPYITNVYITNYANTSDSLYGTSGKNPESVEEAKKESAKYNFTLDSLVTAEDFEKASTRVSGINLARLIDNTLIQQYRLNIDDIIARDDFSEYRGDETPLLPYIVILYLIYGELSENKYINEMSYIEDPDIPGRIDYLNPSNLNKTLPEGTTNTPYYPYKPSNIVLENVKQYLDSKRCILTKEIFGTTKTYPFTVSGTTYLLEPQSPEAALEIANIIDSKLKELFNPESLGFGNKPNFIETVEAIQKADTRIRYFDTGFNSRFINFYNSSLRELDKTSLAIYAGLSWKSDASTPQERTIFPVPFVFNEEAMKFKISWHIVNTEYDSSTPPTGSGTTIPVPDQFTNNQKYDIINLGTEFTDGETRILRLNSLAELNTLVWYLNNSDGAWVYEGR